MSLPLYSTALSLWTNSTKWRFALLSAVVLTLLSFAGSLLNSLKLNSANHSNQGNYNQSSPIQPVSPVNQKADARLRTFYAAASAIENKTKKDGEKCEELIEAAKNLQEGDREQAVSAQKDMIDKKDVCNKCIQVSDEHWAAVNASANQINTDASFASIKKFINSFSALDAFDLSRSSKVVQQWPEKAQYYKNALDNYTKDLTSLESLVLLYRPNDPAVLPTINEICSVYRKIQSSPIKPKDAELTNSQKTALELSDKVVNEILVSDKRLSALDLAWQKHDEDPTSVATVLSGFNSIDIRRWDDSQGRPAKIKEIEAKTSKLLPTVLQGLLANYSSDKKRQLAEQILNIESMVNRLDLSISTEMQDGINTVKKDINESRQRILRLTKLSQQWNARSNKANDKNLEKDILDAVKAVCVPGSLELQPYDAASMSNNEIDVFKKLLRATVEINGKIPSGAGVDVFIYVDSSSIADQNVAPMVTYLKEKLVSNGFKLASTPADASLSLVVWDPAITSRGIDPSSGEKRISVSLRAKILWNYSGKNIDLGITSSECHAPDVQDAIKASGVSNAEYIAKMVIGKICQ